MFISIASDHAGFELKKTIIQYLKEREYEIKDWGTNSSESVDYPDYATKVTLDVIQEKHEVTTKTVGILICGTGNGMAISANRTKKIRCALCWNVEIAKLARQHNDANVIALPARFISEQEAIAIVDAFLITEFDGQRHQRRINKIDSI